MQNIIGFNELQSQITHIIHTVRDEMFEYVITMQGQPIAIIRPITNEDKAKMQKIQQEQELTTMKQLAYKVADNWVSPKSSLEILEEQRGGV